MEMTAEDVQAFASIDIPELGRMSFYSTEEKGKAYSTRRIIAPANHLVAADFQAANAVLMTFECSDLSA